MLLDFFCLFCIFIFKSYANSLKVHEASIKERVELLNTIGASNFSSVEKTRQICDLVLKTMDKLTEAGSETLPVNLDTQALADSLFFLNQHVTRNQLRLSLLVAEENSTKVVKILQDIVNNKTTLTDTKTILKSNNISIVTFHVGTYFHLRDDLRASLKKAKRNGDVFNAAIEIGKFRPVVNAFREALGNVNTERGVIVVCEKQCPNEIEAIQQLMATEPTIKLDDLQAGMQAFRDFIGMENNNLTVKSLQELTGKEENSSMIKAAKELLGKADSFLSPQVFQVAGAVLKRMDGSRLATMNESQLMKYVSHELFHVVMAKQATLSLHESLERANSLLQTTASTGFTTMRLGTILVIAVLALVV